MREEGEATSRKGVHKFDLQASLTSVRVFIFPYLHVKLLSRLSGRIKLTLRGFSSTYLFVHILFVFLEASKEIMLYYPKAIAPKNCAVDIIYFLILFY